MSSALVRSFKSSRVCRLERCEIHSSSVDEKRSLFDMTLSGRTSPSSVQTLLQALTTCMQFNRNSANGGA